jgi:hypothetical protein
MTDLSPQILRELLAYNPDTGELFWRHRDRKWFIDDRSAKIWNTRFSNKAAFTATRRGYFCGRIFDTAYQAHRICWAIHYGVWPDKFIDHINGDRSDNRIENLRHATSAENGRNKSLLCNNSSGHHGVSYLKDRMKWYASIKVNGKTIGLGKFESKPDAIAARKAAEVQYGFHANHGMR